MKLCLIKARAIYEPGGYGGADGLLVREGRIARLGGYDTLKRAYPEAETLDWSALYVLPALVNTHVHLEFDATAQARVHYIDETPAGELCALPRMQMAGPPLTVTGGHLHFLGEETDGVTDMVRQTRLRQKRGCDAVKLIVTGGQMTPGSVAERVSMTTEEIRAVVDEAHLLNVPTFAHCLTTEGFARCMDGGVDCIEHIACFIRNRENGLLERVYEPEVMPDITIWTTSEAENARAARTKPSGWNRKSGCLPFSKR